MAPRPTPSWPGASRRPRRATRSPRSRWSCRRTTSAWRRAGAWPPSAASSASRSSRSTAWPSCSARPPWRARIGGRCRTPSCSSRSRRSCARRPACSRRSAITRRPRRPWSPPTASCPTCRSRPSSGWPRRRHRPTMSSASIAGCAPGSGSGSTRPTSWRPRRNSSGRGHPVGAGLGTVIVLLPQELSRRGATLLREVAARTDVVVLAGRTGAADADHAVERSVGWLGGPALAEPGGAVRPRRLRRTPGDTQGLGAGEPGPGLRVITASDADDETRAAVRVLVDAAARRHAAGAHGHPPPRRRPLGEPGPPPRPGGRAPVQRRRLRPPGRPGGRAHAARPPQPGRRPVPPAGRRVRHPRRRARSGARASAPCRRSRGSACPGRPAWWARPEPTGTSSSPGWPRSASRRPRPRRPTTAAAWPGGCAGTPSRPSPCGTSSSACSTGSTPCAGNRPGPGWPARSAASSTSTSAASTSGPPGPSPSGTRPTKVEAALERLAHLDRVAPAPDLARFERTLRLELDADLGRRGRFGEGVLVGRVGLALGLELDLVVICGMAEGVLPTRQRDDALLPDRDRAAAGDELPVAADRQRREHRELLAAVAAARQEVVLTMPRGDLRRTTEHVASRWLTELVDVHHHVRLFSERAARATRRRGSSTSRRSSAVSGRRPGRPPSRRPASAWCCTASASRPMWPSSGPRHW